ncbi:MAG: biotin/lipoyl-binding protein [Anaerolineae bacterium]
MRYIATINGREFTIDVDDTQHVWINGRPCEVDMHAVTGSNLYSLLIDHVSHEVVVEDAGRVFRVMLNGELFEVKVDDERTRRLSRAGHQLMPNVEETQVKAPIPGLISRVLVEEGQEVAAGQPVAILEAMKMENELRAPRAGTIRRVAVQPGERVEQGRLIVTIH